MSFIAINQLLSNKIKTFTINPSLICTIQTPVTIIIGENDFLKRPNCLYTIFIYYHVQEISLVRATDVNSTLLYSYL